MAQSVRIPSWLTDRASLGWRPVTVWLVGATAIGVTGYLDFLSGVELRVFPLYYVPISFVAWYHSRSGAMSIAALSTIAWLVSNLLAGLNFTSAAIWISNTVMQGLSFSLVAFMIATLRVALIQERVLSRGDPLTSLLNSRAFYEDAQQILAQCRRLGRPVTVAYIDLDNFKAVNDLLGHKAGDDMLQQVADVLRACVGAADLTARLGGDEFAVLLPEVPERDATATLETIRARLADTFAAGPVNVSGSIGGVTFTTAPSDVQAMIQFADAEMYLAKNAGKNQVHHVIAGAPT